MKVGVFRFLLPIAAGWLLVFSFPPFHATQAAWVALVPLLFALNECPPVEAFRRGYLAGLVFFGGTVWWVAHVTLPGAVGLVAFLALYFGLAGLWIAQLLRYARPRAGPDEGGTQSPPAPTVFASVGRRSPDRAHEPAGDLRSARGAGSGDPRTTARTAGRETEPEQGTPAELSESAPRNLLVALLAAAGWVTLEWVRGHLFFGGFPWNVLGVSQYTAVPLIQVASVTGVAGISALLCLVNFAFYFTIRRFARNLRHRVPIRRLSWEFYAAMLLVAGGFLYGLDQIDRRPLPRSVRLSMVQGNIPQTLKWDESEAGMIIERYDSLTRQWAFPYQPDLILWPETATPGAVRFDPDSFALVTNLVDTSQIPLLTGTFDYTPYSEPPIGFNAAILVRPGGVVDGIYQKMHLVPFGEFVPLEKWFPFMRWLTPITFSMQPGSEPTVFELADRSDGVTEEGSVGGGRLAEEGSISVRLEGDNAISGPSSTRTATQHSRTPTLPSSHPTPLRFGVVICFEDTVASICRQFIPAGVDFMVNLTNDGWFKESSEAEIHLANAVFRAVELRRPFVRATNHGITAVIDRYGFVATRLEPFTAGCLNVELGLPADRPLTPYAVHGDRFVAQCAALTAAALVWILITTVRRRPD